MGVRRSLYSGIPHLAGGEGGRAREYLNDEAQVHDGSFASGDKDCILFILQYLHS